MAVGDAVSAPPPPPPPAAEPPPAPASPPASSPSSASPSAPSGQGSGYALAGAMNTVNQLYATTNGNIQQIEQAYQQQADQPSQGNSSGGSDLFVQQLFRAAGGAPRA